MTSILQDSFLASFLGAKKMDELKDKLIEIIVEEVRDQLHESSDYIVSPDDIAEDLYKDVAASVKDQILDEYKTKVMEAIDRKIGNFQW